jgi:hypothetical protein
MMVLAIARADGSIASEGIASEGGMRVNVEGGVPQQEGGAACATQPELLAKHTELAEQLHRRGLDEVAIRRAARHNFVDGRPRRYEEWSLPPGAVRVLALALDDAELADPASRAVGRMALTAAASIAAVLPSGAEAWLQPSGTVHTTIFHPGVSPTSESTEEANRAVPTPTATELAVELRNVRWLASRRFRGAHNVSLIVDRLALTSSGVLLLLLLPAPSSAGGVCVSALRAAAAAAFPRAPSKQTRGLIHASLLRIVSLGAATTSHAVGSPMANGTRAVAAAVQEWSARLRGLRVTLHGLLYVRERQIMSLEGEWTRIRFGEDRHPERTVRMPRRRMRHEPRS